MIKYSVYFKTEAASLKLLINQTLCLCHRCSCKLSICLHQSCVQGRAGERSGVFTCHRRTRRLFPGAPDGAGCAGTRTAAGCGDTPVPETAGRQRGRRPQQEPPDSSLQRRLRNIPAHPQHWPEQTGRPVARWRRTLFYSLFHSTTRPITAAIWSSFIQWYPQWWRKYSTLLPVLQCRNTLWQVPVYKSNSFNVHF